NQPLRQVVKNQVSPEFFKTTGISIVSGRALTETDLPCSNKGCSVIVSEELARNFWPGSNPLGKELRDIQGARFEVVGVAHNTSSQRLGGLDDPTIYFPWNPKIGLYYFPLVRYRGDGGTLARAITANIRQMDEGLTIETRTIQSWMDEGITVLEKMA